VPSGSSEKRSPAAAAVERVKAVLEAAEQSAAELRAEAAEEIDAQLTKAQAIAERLSQRADEIERALQGLADTVRDELSALKADLEELRAVGEGVAEAREEAAESAAAEPAAAPPAAELAEEPAAEPAPAEEAAPEESEPPTASPAQPAASSGAGPEGARVIALNMALGGSSREETAHYLSENFELDDPEALLDEVYARVSS